MEWQSIETVPEELKKMIIAIAVNVRIGKDRTYTSDPYCVWKNCDGTFSRWPHEFGPTHWMPLPALPKD